MFLLSFLWEHSYTTQKKQGSVVNLNEHDAVWSEWSNWSTCSRTCDGGVSSRGRHCIASNKANIKTTCEEQNAALGNFSNYRQHKICNTQPCISLASKVPKISFRAQQCKQYNDVPYKVRVNQALQRTQLNKSIFSNYDFP